MSEITPTPRKYREIAFYFAEKSKSAVLQESIADAQAKSFAGIPQDLVDEEKNLKSGISFLAQKLSLGPPADEEKYLRESLFQLNNEYAAFTRKLEKEYPNYFNLKFNNTFPTVPELQSMLGPDEAMEDLRRILAAREPLYAKADACVDTSGQGPEESLRKLRQALTV